MIQGLLVAAAAWLGLAGQAPATPGQSRSRSPIGISGIRVVAQCAGGSLAVTVLRDSGAPIGDHEKLVVVTTDYLATGGRLREDQLVDRDRPRWVYPGTLPVSCAR
jgi:hypothetical protein